MHPAFIHAIKRLKEHKEAPLIARVNDLDHFTVWAESLVEDFVAEALDFDSEEDCKFFNTLFNEAAKSPGSVVRPSREGQVMICEVCKQAWTELRGEQMTESLSEGIARLRMLCAGQPMNRVIWRRKNGLGSPVRITRRAGYRIWMRHAALGANPPRGMSSTHSVDEVIRDWAPVSKGDL